LYAFPWPLPQIIEQDAVFGNQIMLGTVQLRAEIG